MTASLLWAHQSNGTEMRQSVLKGSELFIWRLYVACCPSTWPLLLTSDVLTYCITRLDKEVCSSCMYVGASRSSILICRFACLSTSTLAKSPRYSLPTTMLGRTLKSSSSTWTLHGRALWHSGTLTLVNSILPGIALDLDKYMHCLPTCLLNLLAPIIPSLLAMPTS